jgi:hypothetical protein
MSFSRNSRRNRRESTRTGRKKPGWHDTHRLPSSEMPPPGTTMWTCGWWVSAEPQVCSTLVNPIWAPRCLGSAAMVISVSANNPIVRWKSDHAGRGSRHRAQITGRTSYGHATSLEDAKAAFRAEYEARKGTKKHVSRLSNSSRKPGR